MSFPRTVNTPDQTPSAPIMPRGGHYTGERCRSWQSLACLSYVFPGFDSRAATFSKTTDRRHSVSATPQEGYNTGE
ncbi:hypothetical protein E2C01_061971 [Portunus trituberculatus]|uniref:Uncharacterized protein n=1 Tax=Portunus trituberculatus TaxID=210409 RepID=A0A5B7HEN4_PORTR|nr:hypothetical protein [Portunus trituberculatus]